MVFLHRAEISGSGGAPFAWTEGTLNTTVLVLQRDSVYVTTVKGRFFAPLSFMLFWPKSASIFPEFYPRLSENNSKHCKPYLIFINIRRNESEVETIQSPLPRSQSPIRSAKSEQ